MYLISGQGFFIEVTFKDKAVFYVARFDQSSLCHVMKIMDIVEDFSQ